MIRAKFMVAVLAGLMLGSLSTAEEADKPATQAGDTFVSLKVDGCADQCAEFEIYIFDNGRLLFRPKNAKNSSHAPVSKNGVASIYTRVAKYLQDSGAFNPPTECSGSVEGKPVAIVTSMQGGQEQKATWAAGCANQLEKARSLVKVFVNQSGMWRNINHDSRYWEKYWETWEEKK